MEALERDFDDNVATVLNQLQTVAASHPNLVADLKAIVQTLYGTFVQAVNKVLAHHSRHH